MPVKMAGQLAQLAELESITQEAGETLFSFITRIRLAAAYTDVLKFGTCSKKTHPDLTLEECKRGPNDEPATELSWPCAKGVGWYTLTRPSHTSTSFGILTDEHKACPPCCKKVDDFETKEWLIKKQFLTKMYDKKMLKDLHMALFDRWFSENLTADFNVLDINTKDIIRTAQVIEQVMIST